MKKTSRILGTAFLLQFITSFGSGVVLTPALFVTGDVQETMNRVASNPMLVKGYILAEMVTALGIIFLGAILYLTLRKENEKMALMALGFYILEAVLCIVGKAQALPLLSISQAYASGGQAADLQVMAGTTFQAMNFVGLTLAMLAFCPGGMLFYYLLYKSKVVPQALSLWGLIAIVPLLIMVLLNSFGYQSSMLLALPYIPFEFVIGVWILVRGIPEQPETRFSPVSAKLITVQER